ncbi:MAG: 30S ribosomal protein S4, partial [Caulobacteraceae bacterium]
MWPPSTAKPTSARSSTPRRPPQYRIWRSPDGKQKLRFHYCIQEKQFRRFFTMAKKSKGNTGNTLMQLLECRLDNVVRRMGVGRTIWATRQIVAHGHTIVDGVRTDIASYLVKPGQTITFREGIHKLLRENMEQGAGHNVPGWIEFNPAQLTA